MVQKTNDKNNGSDLSEYLLNIDDTIYKTHLTNKFLKRKTWKKPDDKFVDAFIPGTILKLYVKDGQEVKQGDKLMVLEAMKMKNNVLAQKPGKISKVHVKEGDVVTKGQVLIEYKF